MSSLSTKKQKKQLKKNGNGKRGRSMFDAVQLLDSQDISAEKKRRATSARDKQRSEAAKSQTKIYGSLVECRILLQRVLQQQQQQQQQDARSGNTTVDDDVDDTDTALNLTNELLTKLLEARRTLLQQGDNGDKKNNKNDNKDYAVDYAKIFNINDDDDDSRLNDVLQSEYESCRENWKEVLDRRYRDVRLHAGLTAKTQFRVLDSSFWQQIESTVQHEELQRHQNNGGDNVDEKLPLFDDSKVYQQMLKEFVAANQAGGGSGGDQQQRAAQMRLLRKQQKQSSSSNKNKPMVDRKASKGRKIRYQEIPKLVNFTFPISRPEAKSSNLDEDGWFRSLFGGVGRK